MNPYYLYILQCADQTLYTGITKELERRLYEHNLTSLGAKYTSGRRPVKLVYFEKLVDKSAALKREILVKKMTREQKIDLISNA